MSRSYRDCKVYIGNLNEDTSKTEVETIFLKYGPLRSTWIARRPPGFAFVEYEDSRDAEDAVRALDGTKICGSRVRVEISHDRSRRESSRRESRRVVRRSGYRESRGQRRRYRSRSTSRSRSRSYSRSRSRSRSRRRHTRSRSRSR